MKARQITPSPELAWESCYNGEFECARLEVPMDWQSPEKSRRVVLGVIKLAAISRESTVPPLFMNPGASFTTSLSLSLSLSTPCWPP